MSRRSWVQTPVIAHMGYNSVRLLVVCPGFKLNEHIFDIVSVVNCYTIFDIMTVVNCHRTDAVRGVRIT